MVGAGRERPCPGRTPWFIQSFSSISLGTARASLQPLRASVSGSAGVSARLGWGCNWFPTGRQGHPHFSMGLGPISLSQLMLLGHCVVSRSPTSLPRALPCAPVVGEGALAASPLPAAITQGMGSRPPQQRLLLQPSGPSGVKHSHTPPCFHLPLALC